MSNASSRARLVGCMPEPLGTKSSSPIICLTRPKAWLTAEGVIESALAAFVTLPCCRIASNTKNKLRSILRSWLIFADLVVSLDFFESLLMVCYFSLSRAAALSPVVRRPQHRGFNLFVDGEHLASM